MSDTTCQSSSKPMSDFDMEMPSEDFLVRLRDNAIAQREHANDISQDQNWLCAQQKHIRDQLLLAAGSVERTFVLSECTTRTTLERRMTLLEKWCNSQNLTFQYENGHMRILLDFLPELNLLTNERLESQRQRDKKDYDAHADHLRHQRSQERAKLQTEAMQHVEFKKQLAGGTSVPIFTRQELAQLRQNAGTATARQAQHSWCAEDDKWLENTQALVMSQFQAFAENARVVICFVKISDAAPTERQTRLLAWLKGLGYECKIEPCRLFKNNWTLSCDFSSSSKWINKCHIFSVFIFNEMRFENVHYVAYLVVTDNGQCTVCGCVLSAKE